MGKVIIFCAPSGAGKNSVVSELLRNNPNLTYSVSATTRKKREGEVDGRDYYFFSSDNFFFHVREGNFIEYEQVYEGVYYGTLKSEVIKKLLNNDVILIKDVKGALSLKSKIPDAITIFIKPPDLKVLEMRLKTRHTETEDQIRERLKHAEVEMSFKDKFDFIVTNDNLQTTVEICNSIISD